VVAASRETRSVALAEAGRPSPSLRDGTALLMDIPETSMSRRIEEGAEL
jgi:hypothetical protein